MRPRPALQAAATSRCEAYMKLARRLGFERFVFVQPSAYGLDNACMLDAMEEVPAELRRGIVHLDETKPNDAVLGKWDALGMRGVRINVSPVRKPEAGVCGAPAAEDRAHGRDLPRAWLAPRLPDAGLADQRADADAAASCRRRSRSRTWGFIRPRPGAKQAGFQEFLKLANDGSKRCWVKLTGIYRFSQDPAFADVSAVRPRADRDRCRTS